METIGALCQAHQSHLNEQFYTAPPYTDTQQGQEFQTCMFRDWLGNDMRFKAFSNRTIIMLNNEKILEEN